MAEQPNIEQQKQEVQAPTPEAFVPKQSIGREALLKELEGYRAEAQELPFEKAEEKAAHEKRIELAEKRIEVMEAMHDNTGALKGDYLGQELKALFEEKGLTLDELGGFEKDPSFESTHLLFVNLGELDRINQEGDHHSGDLALQALRERIERTVQGALADRGEDMRKLYQIFRSGGSKFSIKLDDVSEGVAEKIRQELDQSLDISDILPGKDPAPLAASRISLDELTEVFDRLPDDEKQALVTDQQASRVMIGTAFEMLNQLNDKRETETRLERLIEKIKSGNEEEAKRFYTKFQARALTPMFSESGDRLLSYEEVKEELMKRGALENGAWADTKAEMALKEARRQFEARRLAQRETERKISDVAAKDFLKFQGAGGETQAKYIKQKESSFQEPQATEGKQELLKLAKAKEELEQQMSGKDCPEKGSLDSDCQQLEQARLELELERALRDSMTGLKQRGPLFKELESALESGESASTVYIDMAFLKYFDKEGGRETGNLAILKAGEILDKISARFKEAGKRVEAYRIGGDEFAFSVSGEDETFLKEVLKELASEQVAAGEVPLKGDAPVGVYADQALQFNYGVFHTESKGELKALLKENGLQLEHEGTEKENNELAEYMLRFADKQLEIQKAVNRLQVLLQEGLAADDLESGKYAQLVKYSEKSIFGQAGKDKLRTWRERVKGLQEAVASAEGDEEKRVATQLNLDKALSEIELESIDFAIEMIRAKHAESENYEGSIDKIIEDHVRDKFLEQKIDSLESRIRSLEAELTAEKEENAELRNRLKVIQDEREQLTSLREKIRG